MKPILSNMLIVVAVVGCESPRGGGVSRDEGFRIVSPAMTTTIKQGEVRTVDVSLHRGEFFKQDVKLEMRASKGINVEPLATVVKASEDPSVHLRIAADKEAALGDYRVYVRASPETGEPTSAEFKVKVVTP